MSAGGATWRYTPSDRPARRELDTLAHPVRRKANGFERVPPFSPGDRMRRHKHLPRMR